MSNPYHHRTHYLEQPPESCEDDGSNCVQTFGNNQDDSTHQYRCANQNPIQRPSQQRYQQSYHQSYQQSHQNPIQDQNRLVYPSQYQSQPPDQYYASQQPRQQLLENPIQHPDEDLNEYSDEYSDVYADEYPGEDPDEDADGYSGEESFEYIIEQSSEDPNTYPSQVTSAQNARGSYQTVGTVPATEALKSLGIPSSNAPPGPSQPDAFSHAADTWAHKHGLRALPDPLQNPFGSGVQTVTGFERSVPGTEVAFSPYQEWVVRWTLASGGHIEEIAERAGRDVSSVQELIAWNNLVWTDQQDAQLKALRKQQSTMSVILEHLDNIPGGPNRLDYEVEARIQYQMCEERSSQRAGLADSTQPDPQQYPVVGQPGESVSPHSKQEVIAKTKPPRQRWRDDEIRRLEDSANRHNYKWSELEKEFPGRSAAALRFKWLNFHEVNEAADEGAQASSKPHGQPIGRKKRVFHSPSNRGHNKRHRWSNEDDDKLSSELARGWNCVELARKGFLGLSYDTIRIRAARLKTRWPLEDDTKLLSMILKRHSKPYWNSIDWNSIDWDSIGRQFNPERTGHLVQKRWEFLREHSAGEGSKGKVIEEEDIEEE